MALLGFDDVSISSKTVRVHSVEEDARLLAPLEIMSVALDTLRA